jgi:hypothetical protein
VLAVRASATKRKRSSAVLYASLWRGASATEVGGNRERSTALRTCENVVANSSVPSQAPHAPMCAVSRRSHDHRGASPHYRTLRHVALGLAFPFAYHPHQQPPLRHHSSTRSADDMNTQLMHKSSTPSRQGPLCSLRPSVYTQIVSRDFLAEPFPPISSLGLRHRESTPSCIAHNISPKRHGRCYSILQTGAGQR